MEVVHPADVVVERQQDAVRMARSTDGVALFDKRSKSYRVLARKAWADLRSAGFDDDWHVIRTGDTSAPYFDLDGCGELDRSMLEALCRHVLLVMHERDPESNLVVCDMSRPGHPSFHLTARGSRVPGMTSRQIASLLVVAMHAVNPMDSQLALKAAGLIADFGPYRVPRPQMRAVGALTSDGKAHKVPTHVAHLDDDGVLQWDAVADCPLSREYADCFYGQACTGEDADNWLFTLTERARDEAISASLRKMIKADHNSTVGSYLSTRKRKAPDVLEPQQVLAPIQVDPVHQSHVAVCCDQLSRALPSLARQMEALALLRAGRRVVFRVTKATWTVAVTPNGQVKPLDVAVHGGIEFAVCLIKAEVKGCDPVHSTPKKPLVIFEIGDSMSVTWVCPWSGSHAAKKSAKFRLTGDQQFTVHMHLVALANIATNSADLSTSPTASEMVPEAAMQLVPVTSELRTTAEWAASFDPVSLSTEPRTGNIKQASGCPAIVLKCDQSMKKVADYDQCFDQLLRHLKERVSRRVLRRVQCARLGDARNVKVVGFEDCVLLWHLVRLLVTQNEPCLGVWIAAQELLDLVDDAIKRAEEIGLTRLMKLPGISIVKYAERDGAVACKGVMIGLAPVFEAYQGIKPVMDALVKSGRLIVATANSPNALEVYMAALRKRWSDLSVLVIGPWTVLRKDKRLWIRYVNSVPYAATMSVMESVREAQSELGPHVIVVWDAHLIPTVTLASLMVRIGQDALKAEPRQAPAPPEITLMAANHSHQSVDGATLMQHVLANLPSRVYCCPKADKADAEARRRPLGAIDHNSGAKRPKITRVHMDSVFLQLASDPVTAIVKMADDGLLALLPLDPDKLRAANPDVYRLCTAETPEEEVKRYMLPDTSSGFLPFLAHFRNGDKFPVLKTCSVYTVNCTVILALPQSTKRSVNLQRIMWMYFQPGRKFKRLVVLMDTAMQPALPTMVGPTKFSRLDRL